VNWAARTLLNKDNASPVQASIDLFFSTTRREYELELGSDKEARMSALRRHRDGLLASFCLVALVITAVWPDWIEELTGLEPDNGNGTVEWLFLAVLAVLFLVFSRRAYKVFRSARDPG
jgi:hypothetical protein